MYEKKWGNKRDDFLYCGSPHFEIPDYLCKLAIQHLLVPNGHDMQDHDCNDVFVNCMRAIGF